MQNQWADETFGAATSEPDAAPMTGYVRTYLVSICLIFFAMGGELPVRYSAGGSLQAVTTDTNTAIGMVFQAGIWIVALFLMAKTRGAILRNFGRMKAIFLLSLLAPLSAIWSQNSSVSLRRGVFLMLTTLFALYLVEQFSARELAEVLIIAGVAAAVCGIAVSVLLPEFGLDAGNKDAWQGIFRSKNGCAQVMLFFLTPAIAFRFSSYLMNALRYLLLVMGVLLIVMADAKTAWMLAPAYVVLMGIASRLRRYRRRDATVLAVGAVAVVLVLAVLVPLLLPLVLPALGKDPSLSGRVPLWGASFVSIMKRPMLGYGFDAFWNGLQGESLNIFMSTRFEIHQAQNGVLELGLELGLVGVVLVFATLLRAVRDALVCFQHAHSDAVDWYVGLIALTVAYNVDEAFLARENFLPWLLYLVACAGLAREARKVSLAVARRKQFGILPQPYLVNAAA